MKLSKRLISLLLSIVLVLSVFAVIATASYTAADNSVQETGDSSSVFSWDNASVYFLLTDRFVNGNTSNDHSYNRLKNKDGSIVTSSQLNSDVATFHGGDFAGITKKINEGYFDNLGVNAIWMSAPYEQIHGYVIVNEGKSNSIKHYAYHGYYAMDYTQTDANFGTATEFKTLVDTAHKHGIRIVLDIVMNHPGYNTIYDMREYNFGAFKTGYDNNTLDEIYYNWRFNGRYHEGINYNGGGAYNAGWKNWWDKDWLRCGIDGYTSFGGDDLTKSAGGDLPDFKTESGSTVNVPQFLQTKWSKEGRLSTEQNKLNSYFSSGKSKTVRNYLVFWLSQWVEKYGVDGFRCDTAKHVEFASWKALKDQCNQSLKTWRKNNPNDAAAKWKDDFWMTAEDYGSGVNYDGYYTNGGFDSKINFSFTGGGGVPNSSNINNVYSDYANRINSNDKFNVLSYISSHDTALCRNDMYYQGSAFQLLPGAIQIFYGDESNRKTLNSTVGGEGDHLVRSDMNWSSMDNNLLAHWQKVGKFRRNHIAVGAGSHAKVESNTGLAFSRIYNKNGVSDKVIACIAANNNTTAKIKVSSCFTDGTVVRNAYDNTTAKVSGGYVSFNTGAHGTVLIEATGEVGPTETQTQTETQKQTETQQQTETVAPGTNILGDPDMNGKADIADATLIQQHLASIKTLKGIRKTVADVDGDKDVTIIDATCIQQYLAGFKNKFNIGKPIGDVIESSEATDPTSSTQQNPTYSSDKYVLYVDMGKQCDACAYYWADSDGPVQWPGTRMEHVSGNVYMIEVDKQYTHIIFSNNGGEQTGDLDIPGTNMIFYKNSNNWDNYSGETPTHGDDPVDGITLYADMGFECDAYAYYWATGSEGPNKWPGLRMDHVSGNIYKIVVPNGFDNIIFSNNGDSQTGNLSIPGNNMIYYKNGDNWQTFNN